MSETVYSLDVRRQMTAEHGTEVPIHLLTFTHPDDPDHPVRITSDRTEVVSVEPFMYGTRSRGEVYYWLPLELVEPSDGEDVRPEFQLRINLLNREVFKVIRAHRTPADVLIELISSARPDKVERDMHGFRTAAAPWEGAVANLVLAQRSADDEPYPAPTMNPITAPGLFR